MKCTDCQANVEAYFDGELDEETTDGMAQHLGTCEACASLYARLENEQGLYLSYECDARPAPDFWDNVLARAAEEHTARQARPLSLLRDWLASRLGHFNTPRFSPSLTALLVVVAIGITIGVMRFVNSREEQTAAVNPPQQSTAPASIPDEIVSPATSAVADDVSGGKGSNKEANEQPQLVQNPKGRKAAPALIASSNGSGARAGIKHATQDRERATNELVREAEQKYVAAIAMLSRDVNRRRSRLDPETAARFERTLAAVDRTILDTRHAARKHPGDPVAAQYMLTAYAKKVDVLREMVGY